MTRKVKIKTRIRLEICEFSDKSRIYRVYKNGLQKYSTNIEKEAHSKYIELIGAATNRKEKVITGVSIKSYS